MTDYLCKQCGGTKAFDNVESCLDGETVLTTCEECAMDDGRKLSNRIRLLFSRIKKVVWVDHKPTMW